MKIRLLKAFNGMLYRLTFLLVLLAVLVSTYIVWSNYRVYADAGNIYDQLLRLKPGEEDRRKKFEELRKINPDVVGWITLAGTKIDYPVLQGATNLTYINTDIYGNSSPAGSIFLDSRNDKKFEDAYSLIYGHHIANRLMFGDLDLYKEESFFEQNRTAELITEEDLTKMTVAAVMQISAATKEIFDPTVWGKNLSRLTSFLEDTALFTNEKAMQELRNNPEATQVLALATCSDGKTADRTILVLTAHRKGMPYSANADTGTHPIDPSIYLLILMAAISYTFVLSRAKIPKER